MQMTTKTQVVYLETLAVPRKAWGRIMVTQLASGVPKSPTYGEAKGLPRGRHLLGIQYDVCDVTSWATAVGKKPPQLLCWPITAIPQQLEGHN